MKCFNCDSNCYTEYGVLIEGDDIADTVVKFVEIPMVMDKVISVRKSCINCYWSSHPTKVPCVIHVTIDDEQE